MNDAERIAKLEAQVEALTKRLDAMKTKIVLQAPGGNKSVTIVANDKVAGVWTEDHDKGRHATVQVTSQGPCVGVHDYRATRAGMDVALWTTEEDGGVVQIIDRQKHVAHLTLADLSQ